EAVPRDDGGLVGDDDAHVGAGEVAAIEDAKALRLASRGNDPPVAERVLSARVERQVGSHLSPVPLEQWNEASEVIEVAVTDDQGVDRRRVDLQEIQVVEQRRGREAEVQERLPRLAPALGFQMQRQAELVVDVLTEPGAGDDAEALDLDLAHPRGTDEGILVAVDDHTDRQAIHGRRRARLGSGRRRPRAANSRAEQECPRRGGTGSYEVSSRHRY